jgi:hypothetical protein
MIAWRGKGRAALLLLLLLLTLALVFAARWWAASETSLPVSTTLSQTTTPPITTAPGPPLRRPSRHHRSQRPPSTGFRNVDQALRDLPLGSVAFNTPRSLATGQTAEIHLLVSVRRSIGELKAAITEAGLKEGARVRLSDQMVADLTGLGFQIEPETEEQQAVSTERPTEWRWQIAPTRTGTLHLHLTLSAVILTPTGSRFYTIRTFERTLNIKVTWSHRLTSFVSGNWQWLWTAILVPLALILYRRLRPPTLSANG